MLPLATQTRGEIDVLSSVYVLGSSISEIQIQCSEKMYTVIQMS